MKTHPTEWLAAAQDEYPGDDWMQKVALARWCAELAKGLSPGHVRMPPIRLPDDSDPHPIKTPPEGL